MQNVPWFIQIWLFVSILTSFIFMSVGHKNNRGGSKFVDRSVIFGLLWPITIPGSIIWGTIQIITFMIRNNREISEENSDVHDRFIP